MQGHIALEMNRPGQKHAGRNDHPTAASGRTRLHRVGDGHAAIIRPAGHGTGLGDSEVPERERGRLNARQNRRHMRPVGVCGMQRQSQSGSQKDQDFFHGDCVLNCRLYNGQEALKASDRGIKSD